jgi:hypothetical protein
VGEASSRDRRGLAVPVTRKVRRRYKQILHGIFERLEVKKTKPGAFHAVCEIIRPLRQAAPDYLDRNAIRTTRADARTIAQSIADLESHFRRATLSPELRIRLGLNIAHSPDEVGNLPVPRLLVALKAVRDICEAADRGQPSDDQVKIWCAKIAHTLMVRFSNEKPSSGSEQSSYRTIASLLFEVLTGIRGHDLRRACNDHLRAMRLALQPRSSN